MEKFDPNRELQVWQRVSGGCEPVGQDLRPLLLMAWESAAVYRHLLPMLTGKQRVRMKDLHERALQSVDMLKGIQRMSGSPEGKLSDLPIPREPARRLLEKSFYRSRNLVLEYTARSLETEYAMVYQTLAERERQTAAAISALIGGL